MNPQKRNGPMQYQAGKGHKVWAGQNLWQPFVVAGEAAEAGVSGEAAFDQPAIGQTDSRATE